MSAADKTPEQIAAEDKKADVIAVIIIFTAFVLGAVHFISGWTFDF